MVISYLCRRFCTVQPSILVHLVEVRLKDEFVYINASQTSVVISHQCRIRSETTVAIGRRAMLIAVGSESDFACAFQAPSLSFTLPQLSVYDGRKKN